MNIIDIQQIYSLTRKNFLMFNRGKWKMLWEFIVPAIFAFLLTLPDKHKSGHQILTMVKIYIPIAFTYFVRGTIVNLVNEKHSKMKETLKIMGMKLSSYMFSWYITQSIIAFFICALMTLIFTRGLIETQNIFLTFIILFVFCLSLVSYCFVISTFFSSPNLATQLGTIFYMVPIGIYFAMEKSQSEILIYVSCIFPQIAMIIPILNICGFDATDIGGGKVPVVSTSFAIIALIFDLFFYLAIFWYLDQVIPNEYGISKHPLFIFRSKDKFRSAKLKKEEEEQEMSLNNEYNELHNRETINNVYLLMRPLLQDKRQALYEEQNEADAKKKPAIVFENLTKNFGTFNAVDNLNLKIYENEIFCLLGHNGAGKTTTLNLLTGLYDATRGEGKVYGHDIHTQMDQVRKSLGLCQQTDVLFDTLSCEEHLKLIANLKHLSQADIKSSVRNALEVVQLIGHEKKLAQELSGGMKRKLCLAMALVGNSKLIVLDEPTSGMDPVTRQSLWEVIRRMKRGRAVILSTQHLDEADQLADRIGIMSHGVLLCLGSSNFIKSRFGVGYHLIIEPKQTSIPKNEFPNDLLDDQPNTVKKNELSQAKYEELVKSHIQGSILDPKSTKTSLSFVLPFKEISTYASLFAILEIDESIQFNVEMTSLEDAFINVSKFEDRVLNTEDNNSNSCIGDDSVGNNNKKLFEDEKEFSRALPRVFYTGITYVLNEAEPKMSFFRQVKGIAMKRWRTFYRDIRMWFLVMSPFIMTLISFLSASTNDQLEELDDNPVFDKLKELIFSLLFSIWVIMGYSLSSGLFIEAPVYEREKKLRYVLNVIGCSKYAYWIGNLITDYVLYLMPTISFIVMIFVIKLEVFTNDWVSLVELFLVFGLALISFNYLLSFLFSKATTAFKSIGIIILFCNIILHNFTVGFFVPLMSKGFAYITFGCAGYTTIDIISNLIPVMPLYSGMNLFFGLDALFDAAQSPSKAPSANSKLDNDEMQGNDLFDLNFSCYYLIDTKQTAVLVLFINFCAYFVLTLIIENWKLNFYKKPDHNVKKDEESLINSSQELVQDEDVYKEEEKLLNDGSSAHAIKVKNLSKVYNTGFQAVDNISFGVEKGDVFGLLGPNGAGKSTTFNILTLDLKRTNGIVEMDNVNIGEKMGKIRIKTGICPQFNGIWEKLTVREHFDLIADIKGLNGAQAEEQSKYIMHAMKLDEYITKKCENLSGGNKRKLATGMSLVASPTFGFMDEPSTGVDPLSRRNLWYCIRNFSQLMNTSIILTTHRMEEAQTLCSKIAIMINGKFVCIGSPWHLRSKYGKGYTIFIKSLNPSISTKTIKDEFPNAIRQTMLERSNDEEIYQVLRNDIRISHVFRTLQNMIDKNIISEFSLTQASLEQVFLHFAKFQKGGNAGDSDGILMSG